MMIVYFLRDNLTQLQLHLQDSSLWKQLEILQVMANKKEALRKEKITQSHE